MELLLEVVVLTSSSTEEQGGIFHQWHGEAYAQFVDIATGRNRIRPH